MNNEIESNLICIFCYNVSNEIDAVLKKIIKHKLFKNHLLLINDHSSDDTLYKLKKFQLRFNKYKITIVNNNKNQNYGGNYKIAINFCKKNNFKKLIFLHGDDQYPANKVNKIIKKLDSCELCFGSRMSNKRSSYKNMPLLKYIVNKLLTYFINTLFNSKYSEYFSGFRGIKIKPLRKINLQKLVNGYEIEQQIHYIFIKNNYKITEFPIPTVYDGQISRIPAFKYVLKTLAIAIDYSLFKKS